MQLRFEQATAADAEELVQLQIAAFHHDSVLYPEIAPGGPPGYDSVEHMRTQIARHPCYRIVYGEQTIGLMVIFDQGEGHLHLDVIAIDPRYHNWGFGTLAMKFLEQAHLATCYTLDTPTWALRNQHFYEKLGYVKIGEVAYPDISLFSYKKQVIA
jgi:GNAT superfamily N-acetyltransferase